MTDAIKVYEHLTRGEPVEAAAWFNLGLCQAWTGNNAAAVASLEKYLELEADESQAAQAWALGEVLRFGQGMEDQADVLEYSIAFGVRDPRAFVAMLGELEQEGLLTGTRVNEEEGVLTAIILEPPPPALTSELAAKQSLKPGAYVALMQNFVRLWHTRRESLEQVFEKLRQKLAGQIAETQAARGPAKFLEVLSDAITFPRSAGTKEDAEQRMRQGFEHYYEEQWIHRPLKSLGNLSPMDAAGQGVARKKLLGVIQFLRECGDMTKYPYDFDRLSRKLGLLDGAAPATAEGAKATDIAALNAADLAGLQTGSLSSAELDLAYQTALKLEARELAGTFAAQLVERPPYPERTDRFPVYQFLINQTLAQGKQDESLDYLNDGERDDCENNEGRRRNEYELRRAQIHVKRGEFDQAQEVYDRLIGRVPTDLNYRVNAAEMMLSGRQGTKALKYAQEGLAVAAKQNNRDLEGHFKELMAAAQRQ
jgi:tetratricopeptide (TPR) repeat protein